jgi:hypothetical protein
MTLAGFAAAGAATLAFDTAGLAAAALPVAARPAGAFAAVTFAEETFETDTFDTCTFEAVVLAAAARGTGFFAGDDAGFLAFADLCTAGFTADDLDGEDFAADFLAGIKRSWIVVRRLAGRAIIPAVPRLYRARQSMA